MKIGRTTALIAATVLVAALAFAGGAGVRAWTTEAPSAVRPESARALDGNRANWRIRLVRADPGRLRRPAPRATPTPVPVSPTTAAVAPPPAVAAPAPAPQFTAPAPQFTAPDEEPRGARPDPAPVDNEFDLEG
jgi:hypothetical protein